MPVAALVEPAFRAVPRWHATDGPLVAEVAALAGFAPDPEQAFVLDALFGVDKSGRSVAFETAVVCCRQNMKTGLFKQAALGWLFITGQRLVVWSAHEFATAQEAFRDMDELVTGSDLLRKRVKNIYRGNGDESIQLTTGARLIFKTRTKGGGRGLSGDKVILDEAFALQPMHMGALLPTLSARPDPQVVYGSSAGLAESDVLRGIRDRGRADGAERLAYFEWCATGACETQGCGHALGTVGCVLDDEAAWHDANPALGRRIDLEYVRAERRAMPPLEFARERLGWWDDPDEDQRIPGLRNWADLEDPASEMEQLGAFGIDVTPDRARCSIGVAGIREDGLAHWELIADRPGTDWAVDAAYELNETQGPLPWAVDPAGPAASLIPEMTTRGLEVVELTARQVAQSCVWVVDAVANKAGRHGPQPELAAAVKSARKKDLGDGMFRFTRNNSTAYISPLMAVTLPCYALLTMMPVDDVAVFSM